MCVRRAWFFISRFFLCCDDGHQRPVTPLPGGRAGEVEAVLLHGEDTWPTPRNGWPFLQPPEGQYSLSGFRFGL